MTLIHNSYLKNDEGEERRKRWKTHAHAHKINQEISGLRLCRTKGKLLKTNIKSLTIRTSKKCRHISVLGLHHNSTR